MKQWKFLVVMLLFFSAIEAQTKATDFYKSGQALAAQNKFPEALLQYKKATDLNPNYYDAYFESARIFAKVSDPADAIFCFRKAIKLRPASCRAYIEFGDFYKLIRQKPDSAFIYYSEALKYKCDSSRELLYDLGWVYNDRKDFSKAISYLKRSLALDSVNRTTITELSYSYRMMGADAEGITYFREMYNKAKLDLYLYYIGLYYIQLKDKAAARLVLEELKATDSKFTAAVQKKLDVLP